MSKKILRFLSVVSAIFIILLIAPFFFKDTIKEKLLEAINDNLTAKVSFEDVGISFLSNFPKAQIRVNDLQIINEFPFEGDTLLSSESIYLNVSVTELFNTKNEPISLESLTVKNAVANLFVNKNGVANYDIIKETESTSKQASDQSEKNNSLALKKYALENIDVQYNNQADGIQFNLKNIFHEGKGDFQNSVVTLDTHTLFDLGWTSKDFQWEDKLGVSLDAVLQLDLKKQMYSFQENKLTINQLPLILKGYIQQQAQGQYVDINFSTPSTSIKHMLEILPKEHSGDLNALQTQGDFSIKGKAKGLWSEKSIPTFGVFLYAKNGSFHYPSLPKSVDNIHIDATIENKNGQWASTYLSLKELSFSIDKDVFNAEGQVTDISNNPSIEASLKGIVNLSNIAKVYPVSIKKPLKGILKTDVKTRFDMKSVQENRYQNIHNNGSITINEFEYNDPAIANPIRIDNLTLDFDSYQIKLLQLIATTGDSDIKAKGTLHNFYPFLFDDSTLKGNFSLSSHQFKVEDFMTNTTGNSEQESSSEEPSLKVPSFLDCTIAANADRVLYNDVALESVNGTVNVQNQSVGLKNLNMSVFDGDLTLNGIVDTADTTPTFGLDMQLNQLNIADSFSQLNFLSSIAPIAKAIQGKFNSTIQLTGDLSPELTPNMESVSGNLIGELLSSTVNTSNTQLIPSLKSHLNFLDFDQLNLDHVSTAIQFKNGKTHLKPFTIHYKNIPIQIEGSHGLDQEMNYHLSFEVPASYLGKDVTSLLSNLSDSEAKQITVPVSATIGGSFSQPTIQTDLKNATSSVISQLAEHQKKRLLRKGVDQLGALLGGKTEKKQTTPKDSLKKDAEEKIKNTANKLIKGLFK